MDFDKRLVTAIFTLLSMSVTVLISIDPNTEPPEEPTTGQGCRQVYATEIMVHQNQKITLACPQCTEEWSTKSYHWYTLSTCEPPNTNRCWKSAGNDPQSPRLTITADSNTTYQCRVNGTFKGISMTNESGAILLNVETLTEEEHCKKMTRSGQITVLVAVITSAVILLITVSIAVYFVCKKRVLKSIKPNARSGAPVSCITAPRESNRCVEEYDEDGYVVPIMHRRPEQSYVEIIDVNEAGGRGSNVRGGVAENHRRSIPNFYENVRNRP